VTAWRRLAWQLALVEIDHVVVLGIEQVEDVEANLEPAIAY
jgi:hypothetical protein